MCIRDKNPRSGVPEHCDKNDEQIPELTERQSVYCWRNTTNYMNFLIKFRCRKSEGRFSNYNINSYHIYSCFVILKIEWQMASIFNVSSSHSLGNSNTVTRKKLRHIIFCIKLFTKRIIIVLRVSVAYVVVALPRCAHRNLKSIPSLWAQPFWKFDSRGQTVT